MKKLILAGLAALLALVVVTCDLMPVNSNDLTGYTIDGAGNVTGVTFSVNENGEFLIGSSRNARAVNQIVAERGFEVFEVVFLQGTSVARATWELGDSVSLRNVPRGTAGVGIDYVSVDPADAVANGAAVIFAGRKNGTLLAVGKISAINDTAITTTAVVSATTRSITFGLSALVGNATNFVIAEPASPATVDMKLVPANLGTSAPVGTGYHGYILRPNIPYEAVYTLTASAASFTIAQIAPAVRMISDAGNVARAVQITPRVLLPGGRYGELRAPYAVITPVIGAGYTASAANDAALLDSDTVTAGLQIDFTVGSGLTDGIIALYFQIPVYALNRTTSPDGITSSVWFIRNGYDYNFLDIYTSTASPPTPAATSSNGTGSGILINVASNINDLNAIDYSDGIEIKTGFLAP